MYAVFVYMIHHTNMFFIQMKYCRTDRVDSISLTFHVYAHWTVCINNLSSDILFIEWHVRFTTVQLKPYLIKNMEDTVVYIASFSIASHKQEIRKSFSQRIHK